MQIYESEDGSIVDKFVITDDPDFTPTGLRPDERSVQGPPNVAITSPTDGQVIAVGTDLTVEVNAMW